MLAPSGILVLLLAMSLFLIGYAVFGGRHELDRRLAEASKRRFEAAVIAYFIVFLIFFALGWWRI